MAKNELGKTVLFDEFEEHHEAGRVRYVGTIDEGAVSIDLPTRATPRECGQIVLLLCAPRTDLRECLQAALEGLGEAEE